MTLQCGQAVCDALFISRSLLLLQVDDAGCVQRMNELAERLFGADAVGRSFDELLADCKASLRLQQLRTQPTSPRLVNLRTEGEQYQSFYFSAFPSGDGHVVMGEMDFREIEQLWKHFTEMNSILSNLNRDLQKTTQELAESNELKNRYIGAAAHDLRNPLSVITQVFDLIAVTDTGQLTDKQKQILHRGTRAARFMAELINDLLDISHVESGRLELKREPTDLPPLIEEQVAFHRVRAEQKGQRIELTIDSGFPSLRVDAQRLEQVIDNLLTNAVKYSPKGGTIRVRLETQEGEGEMRFVVSDEGEGIPPGEEEAIFEPFHRTQVQPTGGEKSTGLGLAISRRIVEAHGGRIWGENQTSGGAQFVVALPMAKEER